MLGKGGGRMREMGISDMIRGTSIIGGCQMSQQRKCETVLQKGEFLQDSDDNLKVYVLQT